MTEERKKEIAERFDKMCSVEKCEDCKYDYENLKTGISHCELLYGYEQGRADAIEFISDELIYPLLDECDRGLWEHINYIELAEEWIKALDDNPYPKVKNHNEARKRDLRQWIAEKLKEKQDE